MIPTRAVDESLTMLFSVSHAFSEHLTKREDNQLRDKYDHNSFFYSGQPTVEEVRAALDHQKKRGDAFLKLEGYEPLEDTFGMAPDATLTMVLSGDADIHSWKTNPEVVVRILQAPDFEQLEQHELNYYGPLYGDDFTLRNNRRLREKLTFLGAFLDGKLAGSCYIYPSGGYVCMDSLLVSEAFRHQYAATTLIKHIAEQARKSGDILYLHADPEDTPKEMYARMGFQVTDKMYEYLCTDFSQLRL